MPLLSVALAKRSWEAIELLAPVADINCIEYDSSIPRSRAPFEYSATSYLDAAPLRQAVKINLDTTLLEKMLEHASVQPPEVTIMIVCRAWCHRGSFTTSCSTTRRSSRRHLEARAPPTWRCWRPRSTSSPRYVHRVATEYGLIRLLVLSFLRGPKPRLCDGVVGVERGPQPT